MARLAVYAGTFDPPTVGHLWMIEAGAALFDEGYVPAPVFQRLKEVHYANAPAGQ